MGKRGPAPKPTALRVLHGDRKARINDQEPVPPESEIVPPEEISPDARQVWERLAPSLIACGVLTPWDVDAFWMACEALARYPATRRVVPRSPASSDTGTPRSRQAPGVQRRHASSG